MSFFTWDHRDAGAYRRKAAEVDARFDASARTAWIEAVTAPGDKARTRLEALRQGKGYLVTTGQQPGLFGGPLYSLYKALTAAALADALEEVLDAPVAPLFWTASEDHDWAETDHTWLVGMDNELHRLEVSAVAGSGDRPLHRLPLGEGIAGVIERCTELLPDTDFSAPYLELLREAYTPDATLPSGFEQLLAHLLEPTGMLFVQAHAPALKRLSTSLLLAELDGAAGHEAALRRRAEELEAAGYHAQVPILDEGVNLFLEGPAARERVYRDGEGFRLRHSELHLTRDEIVQRVDEDPSVLSPNVLLRPVVESHVFPTLAYVAGPGELAYFAELEPLFRALDVGMPVVVPRLGATAVESKIRKVLDKFDLEVEALDRPFHELAGEIARDEVPADVQKALGELRGAVARGTQGLTEAARDVDPTLKGPIQHVRSVTFDALGEVEKKIVQAVKRENEIALQQLEKAHLHLFPEGKPQERVFNPLYYLARYGGELVGELHARFRAALPLSQPRG